jgi:hypothetical protein
LKKTITIQNLKPLSVNATYYGTGAGFTKTSKARKWTHEAFFQLDNEENKQAMKELREAFDPDRHCYRVELTAFYPKSEMYTRDGRVSARTHDLTNWEKAIVDCIFLKAHHGRSVPDGCENLNSDDKYIVELLSKKRAGTRGYEIVVSIEILKLEVIDNVGETAVSVPTHHYGPEASD